MPCCFSPAKSGGFEQYGGARPDGRGVIDPDVMREKNTMYHIGSAFALCWRAGDLAVGQYHRFDQRHALFLAGAGG